MDKIIAKFTMLKSKDSIVDVIPGCIQKTQIYISRGIQEEVRLMDDGTVKTVIPELASWKGIISLHSLGSVMLGLCFNGNILTYGKRIKIKEYQEEWSEIWDSIDSWKNIKQLITQVGSRYSPPFIVGLNYDGRVLFSGGYAVAFSASKTWSDIERLLNVHSGVLALRKDRILLGSGIFSVVMGKKLASEMLSNDDYWYLENNEVACIVDGSIVILENISKIIRYNFSYYAYLTCDGTVYSKHLDYLGKSKKAKEMKQNAIDILTFGDEGKYLAVLYNNGEVRVFVFLEAWSKDEISSPLNDEDGFEVSQSYALYSSDVICKNAQSIRFEDGKLIAKVDDGIAPEETTKSVPAINAVSIQEVQENATEANISQWIPYEHSDEYQKYYDRIFSLIEPEIERVENASSTYPTKPINIVQVYTASLSPVDDIFALTKEGRVHYFKISELEQESEAKRREVQLRKLSEWRDIVDLAINGNYVSGLRKDGTVVTTSSYDCAKWDDIVQIVMGDWCLAGLRRDGTVIISANMGNNITMDVKKWRNISSIAAGAYLFGLTSDGRVVRYYNGGPSDNPVEISTLSDISSIAVEGRTLYALTKDKNMITIPQREYAPVDLSQTIQIYNICSFVFAQQSSGRLEILNKEIYYKDDWADACALEKIDGVVFSVMPDGSLKANWYQDKDTRFKDGSIVLTKRLELIDKLKKTKGIARLHFQDGHNLYGEYKGVLATLKNGSIVTLDDAFNGNIPSTNNAGNEFVIKDQSTIAILNECSLTFKMRIEKIGETTFEYEHFTLENVQSAHLYDKDKSLFVKYNDNRYLSVGRVFFSSTSTREPLAYSSMDYHIERGSKRSREIKHVVYGIAGIAKDNRPFILSDELKFPLLHVLMLESEKRIIDCAKADMGENRRFCFLRDDGTVLTLDTDLFEIEDSMIRKTSIRYWNNVRKLVTNGDWIWGVAKDNRFVMTKPSKTNQDIFDAAEFEYWVPAEGEVGDKGETIYTNEGASVILYLDGSLKISGERELLPFYPLPIMKGIKRLLINDRYFFVLTDDGTLWCSKKRFDLDERYSPDGTMEQKKKYSKWEQTHKGIIDITNRGDMVYLRIWQEELDSIHQGEGEKVIPITDPAILDFLSSQEYESIAGNKSIQKKQSAAEKIPNTKELQDNSVMHENAEKDKNVISEAALGEVVVKKKKRNVVELSTPPSEETVEITEGDSANITSTTAISSGTFQHGPCYSGQSTNPVSYEPEPTVPTIEQVMSTYVQDKENEEYKYSVFSFGFAWILKYKGNYSTVTVPTTLDNIPITAISGWAFEKNRNITSITLPSSITTIFRNAFDSCECLTEIKLPEKLGKIEHEAFRNCSNLTSIVLPKFLEIIEGSVFEGCTNLTSIVLPNSLKVLESNVFKGCSKLTSIELPSALDTMFKNSFPTSKKLIMIVPPNSPMEAWVREKGFQYTYSSSTNTAPSSPSGRSSTMTIDDVKEITQRKLIKEREQKIASLKKEIVELNSELSVVTGWFKGRQRRELQIRIGEKKAELEKLDKH